VLRHYTGHDAMIRSLAFSADGRLLASAADDQTVCLWTLTDLPKTLGQRGLIDGLVVKTEDNQVVVAKVAADSPAAEELKPGQVIEAPVPPRGRRLLLTSARHFYRAVWEAAPGAPIELHAKDHGKVLLHLGQGLDEPN